MSHWDFSSQKKYKKNEKLVKKKIWKAWTVTRNSQKNTPKKNFQKKSQKFKKKEKKIPFQKRLVKKKFK